MNIVERSKDILLDVGAAPILYLMIALSVVSIAIILERAWFFFISAEDLTRLASALEEKLTAGDLAGAHELTVDSRSIESAIVRAGLTSSERGAKAASAAMASATAIGRLRLERRLSFLGTLGNAEALEHIIISHLEGGLPHAERAPDSTPPRAVRLSLGNVPFKSTPIVER